MAQIQITFDTNEKTLAISMDGENLENVMSVDICKSIGYGYGGDGDGDADDAGYCCRLCMCEQDEEHDTKTITHVVAADSAEAKKTPDAVPFKKLEGFVVVKATSKVENDILKHFGCE